MFSTSRLAGLGGIPFGVLMYGGIAASRTVGGGYSPPAVGRYLAPRHHALGIASIYLSLLGVLGLVLLRAHPR